MAKQGNNLTLGLRPGGPFSDGKGGHFTNGIYICATYCLVTADRANFTVAGDAVRLNRFEFLVRRKVK